MAHLVFKHGLGLSSAGSASEPYQGHIGGKGVSDSFASCLGVRA